MLIETLEIAELDEKVKHKLKRERDLLLKEKPVKSEPDSPFKVKRKYSRPVKHKACQWF